MEISLGDVVEEEGRIYGDGVNIAARLQALAEGGGICISSMVHDAVKGKVGFEYEDLGKQTLKNMWSRSGYMDSSLILEQPLIV